MKPEEFNPQPLILTEGYYSDQYYDSYKMLMKSAKNWKQFCPYQLQSDGISGDATLFKSAENYEVCWALLQPVLDAWAAEKPTEFPNYAASSFGPEASDDLLARDGRVWKNTP